MRVTKSIKLDGTFICFEFEDGRTYEIDIQQPYLMQHLREKNWFHAADESEVEYFIEQATQ